MVFFDETNLGTLVFDTVPKTLSEPPDETNSLCRISPPKCDREFILGVQRPIESRSFTQVSGSLLFSRPENRLKPHQRVIPRDSLSAGSVEKPGEQGHIEMFEVAFRPNVMGLLATNPFIVGEKSRATLHAQVQDPSCHSHRHGIGL